MPEQYCNDPGSTLAIALTDTIGTSVSVASATGYPSSGNFRIRIDNELMLVTAVSGTTFTVTRGIESTTAATHLVGAPVNAVYTAAGLTAILSPYAPLASPTFTGTPAAPTPTTGNSTTTIATTAFVTGAITTAQALDEKLANKDVNSGYVGRDSAGAISVTAITASPAVVYSYSNPLGSGYRIGSLPISNDLFGGANLLIDGNTSNATDWFRNYNHIIFDFGTPVCIIETTIYIGNGTGGIYTWSGSNDGSSYTGLGNTATLNVGTNVDSSLSGNTTFYRYYQVVNTVGSQNQPTEFNFKLGYSVANTTAITSIGKVSLSGTTNLTGTATALTPTAGDNTTNIATTAFVTGELTAKAPLASPAFTGNPTAPTQSAGNNSTRIATTAYVDTGLATKPTIYSGASNPNGTPPIVSPQNMTSNTAPSPYVASASTTWAGNANDAWLSFSGASGWVSGVNPSFPQWIKIDLGVPATIGSYSMVYPDTFARGAGAAPKNFTLDGSSDNSGWTTVDTRTNETSWVTGATRTYTLASNASYRYWRINVTANNGDGAIVNIGQIKLINVAITSGVSGDWFVMTSTGQLFGPRPSGSTPVWPLASPAAFAYLDATSSIQTQLNTKTGIWYGTANPNGAPPVVSPQNMTSNSAPSPYVATQSSGWDGTQLGYLCFTGTSTQGWVAASGWSSPQYVQVDIGSTVSVGSYSVTYPDSYSQGPTPAPRTWTLQGSANGSSWTVVDTVTNETSWTTGQQRTYILSASATYRYWRFNITANNGNGSVLNVGQIKLNNVTVTSGILGDWYLMTSTNQWFGPRPSGTLPTWPTASPAAQAYLDATSSVQTQLDSKAPLASPALTGNPTAPTQTAGNNSTRIATTAYVDVAQALDEKLANKDANSGYVGRDSSGGATVALLTATPSGTTSYSNSGGQGSRTSLITVTCSAGVDTGTNGSALVDGNTASGTTVGWFHAGNTATFDFGLGIGAVKINEATIYVSSTTFGASTYTWAGSNDNSSYTTLGTSASIGVTGGTVDTSMSANTTSYRYYKMTTNANANLYEVTFKIAPPAGLTTCVTVGGLATFNGTANFNSTTTAPTPSAGDNSTNVATTAFVRTGFPQKYSTTFTSQTSLTVTHNLGTLLTFVQVWDTSSPPTVIWPETVVATSSSVVTITFGTSQSGTILVIG